MRSVAAARKSWISSLGYLKQVQYHLVHTDEDTVELAEKFIDFGILKKKSFDDCQHIAAAILAGCDIITSWNFKHIVNPKTRIIRTQIKVLIKG